MERQAIQLFSPSFRIEECLSEIRKCMELGWTGLGFRTNEFEDAWKQYTGLPNAHFLNSATAGLHLAIKVLKDVYRWENDDEVISTPLTFVSTNHAILYENLKVVFADIDEMGCLDPLSVEQRITPRTRAVIFVGLGGNVGQYKAIEKLCKDRGLLLILDAAHMAGTRYNDKTPGTEADVIVYSYQAVKNLPTADSGMICFRDTELDRTVRQLSWLGIDKDTFARTNSGGAYKWYYDVPMLGFKEHGNSIMASIALVQLKYLDQDNSYRRQLCKWYDNSLGSNKKIVRVGMAEGCESSRHLYQVRVKNRDEILLALNAASIFPGVHYRDNTEFTMYSEGAHSCPNARQFSNEVISLPLHLKMTRQDVDYVSQTLISTLNR
ncbi:DegT/DnrJ/EryC1/StrS family aminotransferase [Methylobacterium sp. M6A4_1b]